MAMGKRVKIRENKTNGGRSVYLVDSKEEGKEFYMDWQTLFELVRAFAFVEEGKRLVPGSAFLGKKLIARLVKYAAGLHLSWEVTKERLGIS